MNNMTGTNTVIELEELIQKLRERGVTTNEMKTGLGIEHGRFYSWRRSVKKAHRDEMSMALSLAFADRLKDAILINTEDIRNNPSIELKYINLIEQKNLQMEKEILELKEENRSLLEGIMKKLEQLEKKNESMK